MAGRRVNRATGISRLSWCDRPVRHMTGEHQCLQIRQELGLYLLGTIEPAQRAVVAGHLATCRGAARNSRAIGAPGPAPQAVEAPRVGPAKSQGVL